jgi:cytochrome b
MESKTIRLWDLPLRLFHWLLVIGIIAAYVSCKLGGLWLTWHSHIGLFIIALLVFRFVWGFTGSSYARFSNFFPTPKRLRVYFSSTWPDIGHNPLGALAIFALLGLVFIQAGFGLFAMNDEIEFHGPLYELVNSTWSEGLTSWHVQGFNALLLLIGIHMSAIGYYTWVKRKNLILPMITGKAFVGRGVVIHPINGGGKIQFIIAVTIASWVFWSIESGALVEYLSPPLPVSSKTTVPAW